MKPRVAIIFGGKSTEHQVSLNSATNIYNAIDRARFEPVLLGVDPAGNWRLDVGYDRINISLPQNDYFLNASFVYLKPCGEQVAIVDLQSNLVLESFDIAFPIIHGNFGEDGTLQGILTHLDIAFVGPDILGSAIGMDKEVAKRLLRDAEIPIAAFFTLYSNERNQFSFAEITEKLGLPLFVKPANAGSSVGVSKVTNQAQFELALTQAFFHDRKILIEEAIIGKEVECAVLGNEDVRVSVLGEIVTAQNFYSYDDKYINLDGIQTKIPAEINQDISEKIRSTAARAFQVLCCEGMSRVDFFLKADNSFVLNEINTLPGFTTTSMYPKLWEHTGLKYTALLTKIIELATERHARNKKLQTVTL